jgi:hypothetical protein
VLVSCITDLFPCGVALKHMASKRRIRPLLALGSRNEAKQPVLGNIMNVHFQNHVMQN